ncbi:MAG TPA: hypothetical protein VG347_02975 [Verrucomicrobiae bacterium]|nr:hypothetical protein [Verrucomicrobiae bacterium]
MRPRFLILTLIVAAVFLAIVFLLRPAKQTVVTLPGRESVHHLAVNTSAASTNANQNLSSPQQPALTLTTNLEPSLDDIQKFISKANENYHKPIEFYGQVIDQNSEPMPNVKIKASVTQEQMTRPLASGSYPIANNIVKLEKETTADGRFEITGEWGSALDIDSIEKTGYEAEPTVRSHENKEGSPNNPVIFKMWTTNIHEQLVGGSKSFEIVPDGKPYFINFKDDTISQSVEGDLKVWIQYTNQPVRGQLYDWSAEIDVIDGGLLEEPLGSPMFEAPTDGYVPSFVWKNQIKGGQRGQIGDRQFYLQFKNGSEYGQMSINLYAPFNDQTPGLIRLSYTINPSGSRVLR